MKLGRLFWGYCKGMLLLPYYVKRTYHITQSLAPSGSDQNTQMRDQHIAIYKELEAYNVAFSGELLVIDGVRLVVDPPRVIETINEVILGRGYDFLEDASSYVMIDIGMNVGIASLLKANDPKFKRIYSFEPVKQTYEIALRNIDLNPDLKQKIEPFNFGLSDTTEQMSVKFSPDEIMSVSSEATFDSCFTKNVTRHVIQLRKATEVLEPILKKHRNEKIFVKIDCEGAEFKIMRDLENGGLLSNIDILIAEWHGQKPDPLLEILARTGFFYFLQTIKVKWNVGIIRAVKLRPSCT